VKKAKFSTIEPRRSSPGDRVSHSKDLAGLVEDFRVVAIGLVQGERDRSFRRRCSRTPVATKVGRYQPFDFALGGCRVYERHNLVNQGQ
jgi:hypothetical protein